MPFINVMKSGRPWIVHLNGGFGGADHSHLAAAGLLDADGYPTSMPSTLNGGSVGGISTLILTDQDPVASTLAGPYRLTWSGAGSIELRGAAVSDVVAGSGQIDFHFTPAVSANVEVRLTAITEGDHIRDLAVVHTDHLARHAAGEFFNPLWLELLENRAHTLRFMDWMQTNDSTLVTSADRPQPGHYTYSRGVPVETMVAVANQLLVNAWFCMPHLADDDFVTNFATYVRVHLDPQLTAYVEYSNEIWNTQFGQTHWARAQAEARWGAGLPGDPGLQFAGLRAARVMDIWMEVYGADRAARLVRVAGVHTRGMGREAAFLEAPLSVAEDNSAPAASFDAYALTGYFGGQLGRDPIAATVLNWIAESLESAKADAAALGLTGSTHDDYIAAHRYDRAVEWAARELLDGSVTNADAGTIRELVDTLWPYHRGVSTQHGLQLLQYEAGTHVVGVGPWSNDEELTGFFTHLNYAPEMAQLIARLLAEWDAIGDAPFNQFVDVRGPDRFGSWGALRHLQDDNPRWRVLASWPVTLPAAPAPPTLIATGQDSLDVIWTAPESDGGSAITHFDLQWSADGGENWTVLTNQTSPTRLAGFAPGTVHAAQVRAANAVGVGLWSGSGTGETDGAAPRGDDPIVELLARLDAVQAELQEIREAVSALRK